MENGVETAGRGSGKARLTPRERDCLKLLSFGLLATEVKTELGISQSTLEAHLASARRKLDTRTTLQAVLQFCEETRSFEKSDSVSEKSDECGSLSEAQIELLDALAHCQVFTEAWSVFQHYLSHFDIFTVNFGVIADPSDGMDRLNVSFWSAASDELTKLYETEEMGKNDPIALHIAHSLHPRAFNVEESLPLLLEGAGHLPPVVEYLMDYGKGGALCIPARDPLTGAALGMNLPLAVREQREFGRAASTYISELSQSLDLFWHVIQQKHLISGKPRLTKREQEALQFIARGFAVAELAERLHVSQRATEQFIAGARAKLGARNNTQAVYRAMVYRAIS